MNVGGSLSELVSPSASLVEAETGRVMRGGELVARARAVAGALAERGVVPGDVVALIGPQTIGWYVVHLAADLLGALTVPLNTRYTDPEIDAMLAVADPKLVAVDTAFLGRDYAAPVRRRADALGFEVVVLDGPVSPGWTALADLGSSEFRPQSGVPEDTICFATSGTTALPKLAKHGRSGIAMHCRAVADRLSLGSADVVMAILPPTGAYGYTVTMAGLAAGAEVVLVRAFRPDSLGPLVASYSGTFVAATEPILRAALQGGRPSEYESLRWLASAGGSLKELAATFASVGVALVNVYGASEALALTAIRDPGEDVRIDGRWNAGGRIVSPGLEIRVVDADGVPVDGDGAEGELQLRGPTIFRGYLNRPDATAEAFAEGGWYRSKDRARIDGPDSFTYLARLTDTMRLKGYLVEPAQVESVLREHPSIREAEVVGVPDASGEDVAVAFVVTTGAVDPKVLIAWCRDRLAAFKVPQHLFVVDEIPKTPSANGDKPLKRDLQQRAQALLEGAVSL